MKKKLYRFLNARTNKEGMAFILCDEHAEITRCNIPAFIVLRTIREIHDDRPCADCIEYSREIEGRIANERK